MTFKPARLLVTLLAAIALPVLAQNLAIVNDKKIPLSRVDAMLKQAAAQGQKDSPELRQMIKDELITREILIQEADKLGLGTSAEVKSQIDNARQSIIIGALVRDYMKKNPIAEADITAEYERFKAQTGDKEYRARHILVEHEDDATAIIAKLTADFAAVWRMPDVQQHLMAQGFDPGQTTPEEFAARIKKEVETPL